MFKINKDGNSIETMASRSFSELGFKERHNLQEWIAKVPSCLGEELLIIQKEFAGFSDTSERLDLLAIDKQGSLSSNRKQIRRYRSRRDMGGLKVRLLLLSSCPRKM